MIRRLKVKPGLMGGEVRILVISSCTHKKAVVCDQPLTLHDFRDPLRLSRREMELGRLRKPASEMYTGEQHIHLMEGVRRLRRRYGFDVVTVRIISAGYGLIAEDRPIVPYDVGFKEMTRPEARAWARHLGVPRGVRDAIAGFKLVFFLLGDRYLDVIDPPPMPVTGQRLVFLTKPAKERVLRGPGITVVPAGRRQVTAYGAGLIALKGRMFDLFARTLVREGLSCWEAVYGDDSAASFLRALATVDADP